MRKLAWLFLGFISFGANAQMNMDRYDSVIYHKEVSLKGFGDYSASAIQNTITTKFIRGGFIDATMKDNSMVRHSAINRAGGVGVGEISFRNYDKHLFKNKEWGFEVKAGANYFGGALYGKDLFGLAMYGNERYVGDTIQMSGMNASFVGMQKIGFGLFDTKTKSGITLNLYNISTRAKADFRDLEIIQSEDGQDVTVIMDGEVTIPNSSSFNQGFGVGIDADFRIPITWYKDRTAYMQFLAQNVGFGYMYTPQLQYHVDTTFTFSGFRFDQIMGDNNILNDSTNILDTLGIRSSEVTQGFLLPGFLQVSKMVDKNSDQIIQSFFGVRIYPSLIYAPFAFAGIDGRISENIHAGMNLSYGGFAGFKMGIYGQFDWNKLALGVGSDNLLGSVRGAGNGISCYLNLVCRF